jgi:predicted transcriptional regulator
MQNQPIGGDLDARDRRTERLILNLVVNQEQRPWSIEEIARTLGTDSSRPAIEDALAQLRAVGLINQADELVFASQAAVYIDYLGMLSV